MSTPPEILSSSGISIRGLTLRVGSRTLLEDASADFPAGQVTLVVGASGAGKSVLLRVLAGLLGPGSGTESGIFHVSGSIRIGNTEVLRASCTRPPTGIVFQSFALFDEMSVIENVQFAADHRAKQEGGKTQGKIDARTLLDDFQVPTSAPVSALSVGQKQRLAIARTLAYDPPVIIYDEPTSGLDPANAVHVAQRIRETGARYHKTSIVVTHDYSNLASIAQRVYLLDPRTRSLTQVPVSALDQISTHLAGAARTPEPPPSTMPGAPARLGRAVVRSLEITGAAMEVAALSLGALVPIWRSPRWGLRYLRHYLGLIASPSSWLYFGSAGVIAGFVSTHFVFKFLPHKQHTLPLIADDLLTGLGFALYRIIVPVLVTILIAARCGAAVASDVGNRGYYHQIDALRSLGVKPERYLLTNILLAFLLATPFLVGAGFLAAEWTSLVVYAHNFPANNLDYWSSHFHRDLKIPGHFLYRGTGWLVLKVLASGLGIGLVAYHVGLRPKMSGVDVSRAITTTIIWATLLILLVHFAFAFVEF